MDENIVSPIKAQENAERYKNLIVALTVFTTVLAAVLAALQVDANIRAYVANRESQYLAILATSELTRAGLASDYEFVIFGDYLKNLQEATILELTALEQEERGNDEAAQTSRELAKLAQMRADIGERFSIIYNDPRYAPQSENDLPNADQYITDVFEKSNEIVAQQNAQADAYHAWDRKADLYSTGLTVLVISFFLFGLAQALKDVRLRLVFAFLGIVVIGFSLLITATTLII